MVTTIEKDILTVESGMICHQVNCMGVMGAGLAKQIADKWPHIKASYLRRCKEPIYQLGNCDLVPVGGEQDLFIVSMFGQYGYGRSGIYTDYEALESCLYRVAGFKSTLERMDSQPTPVYLPHGVSCGLAGGNWSRVLPLIEKYLPDAVLCKLP